MRNKNQVKEDNIKLRFITILTIALLILSVVSLGVALFKPIQSDGSSAKGEVTANVVGPDANGAESGAVAGKVTLNVVPVK